MGSNLFVKGFAIQSEKHCSNFELQGGGGCQKVRALIVTCLTYMCLSRVQNFSKFRQNITKV